MFRASIQNFQSIANLDLELSGFTVITGHSNAGKSAILRALSGAMHHATGTHFVRTGQKDAIVKLHIRGADGKFHDILWEKGKSNRFTIDGSKYDSVGKAAPEALVKLGFHDVQTVAGAVRVLHADQDMPHFMLADPGQSAALVALTSRVDVIQRAQRLVDADIRSVSSDQKLLERQIADTAQKIEHLEPLELLGDLPVQVEWVHTQTVRHKLALEEGRKACLMYERSCSTAARLREIVSRFAGAGEWATRGLAAIKDRAGVLTEAAANVNRLREAERSLQLRPLTAARIEPLLSTIKTLAEEQSRLESARKLLESWRSTQQVMQAAKLRDLQVADVIQWAKEAREVVGLLAQVRRVRAEITALKAHRADLEKQRSETDRQLEAMIKEAGTCPLCGETMHVDKVRCAGGLDA